MAARLHTGIAVTTALLLLVSGCGKSGPTTAKPTTSIPRAPLTAPVNQLTSPLPAAGQDQGKGQALLAKVRQVLQAGNNFQAELTSRVTGNYKGGERQSTTSSDKMGYKITWARPAKFRAEVVEADNSLMVGALIVTTDGMNITARPQGLLSFVKITSKANDKRIANPRNHTFDKFNPNAQMARMTGASAVWTFVDEQTAPNGAKIVRCAIDGVPRLDNEIDREVIGVDLNTNGMRSLIASAKGKVVVQYEFSKWSWNVKLKSDAFVM
jgi:hypothetical protein